MRTLKVQLVGTTPLLLHRVSEHERRGEIAVGFASGQTLAQAAREVMSIDEKGRPAVPVEWVLDSLRRAAAKTMENGQQVSFCKLKSALILPEELIPLWNGNGKPLSWRIYQSAQHSAPQSSEIIAVAAPQFKEWSFFIEIAVNGDFPSDTLLAHILEEAGKCGIGLFHPPKKQFGQFHPTVC